MQTRNLNPDNPLAPSFPSRRESSGLYTPQSGQNLDIDPLRWDFFVNWIPACAGMTRYRSNEQSGLKTLLRTAMAGIAALLLSSALADDSGQHKIVNGVAIYLGVMPAEMILGHPKLHTEAKMHGGVPVGEHQRHVLVTLFDAASGKRIVGAKVSARVYELNSSGTQKKLEPMLIANTVSYGNYFNIPANNNPYRIRVLIELPGVAGVIETEFEYQRARA